jgi:uncharacterized damage-inducible protein DinB
MKQLLTSYAIYDRWANEQLFNVIVSLTEAQQEQVIKSSFPSIHKTCSHMWDAYRIWWQRLQDDEKIIGPTVDANHPIAYVVEQILIQNQQWTDWVSAASEATLEAELSYKNMKGEPFRQPVKEILLHVSNHGTYHRGQLVTMLREVGVEQIPQTDYIIYSRRSDG